MGSVTETTAMVRELEIAASPETVWGFLVDPAKAERWMGQSCTFDARPGGEYRCDVVPGHVAVGSFVEVEPARRLVFTWGWESRGEGESSTPGPGGSTIEIELEPSAEGTSLRFTHRDLTSEEVASHGRGWDHYLPRLVEAAGGGDPGRDPWLDGQM
jgi:uncharacterized protein YndB with AHSA1/START domain